MKSGADKDVILDAAYMAISGLSTRTFDLTDRTKRVLFFYKLLFRHSPIVVIQVPERSAGQQYADVTAATRALTDEHDLTVVVDGSPNSLPPELLTTIRQVVVEVRAMSKEMIESIDEFQGIVTRLKKHGLDEATFAVLGGVPALYRDVKRVSSKYPAPRDTEFVAEVKGFLLRTLLEALTKNIVCASANTKEIIKIYKECLKAGTVLTSVELKARGKALDYPNKVFRETDVNKRCVVEPATAAVDLILRDNIVNDDQCDAYVAHLCSTNAAKSG